MQIYHLVTNQNKKISVAIDNNHGMVYNLYEKNRRVFSVTPVGQAGLEIMVLLIASAKGGVGKSTTALGMALSLSRDRRVLLLDADVSSRSLDVFCGASPTFHLGDVLLGRCDMARAVCVPFPEVYPNLSFCPAPFYKEEAELPDGFAHAIPQVIDTAAGAYDAVVIDTGSGFAIPRAVASHCDTAFVCSEQSPASIRAAAYSAEMLATIPMVRLLICNFDLRSARRGERAGMLEMIDACHLRCVGVIPHDPRLMRCQEKGEIPRHPTPAMQAYRNVALRLIGYSVPLFNGIRLKSRHAL